MSVVKDEKTFISAEHSKMLPTVRIKKIKLKDFKSVGYGEITFNCGRQFIPYDTESDIMGIYGQNGAGKTSLIEALSIVKRLMSGTRVFDDYADCIAIGKEYSELEFVFDLQYTDKKVREATYSFCIMSEKYTTEELNEKYKNAPEEFEIPVSEMKVIVFNEKFYLQWEGALKKQLIIDTSSEKAAFVPDTKRKMLAGGGKKSLISLEVNKQLAKIKSRSFIFLQDTLSLFKDHDEQNIVFQVLVELRLFARHYLFVIDTKSSGFIRLNLAMPVYTRYGRLTLDVKQASPIPEEIFDDVRKNIDCISIVLCQLIPGLTISVKKISDTLLKNGKPASVVMLVAYRDGKELPLRDESDGIRKIISVLRLITAAFNEKSVTVAIDEFDAGIFEYLLGEILQAMEESGKGQFIFTSHNLRPLEVLDNKFLYFTSTNPQNRYVRLKNITSTNNLRDTYLREILLNEQDVEVYDRTKRYKIISALRKVAEEIN